jgi:hypothetical protein
MYFVAVFNVGIINRGQLTVTVVVVGYSGCHLAIVAVGSGGLQFIAVVNVGSFVRVYLAVPILVGDIGRLHFGAVAVVGGGCRFSSVFLVGIFAVVLVVLIVVGVVIRHLFVVGHVG